MKSTNQLAIQPSSRNASPDHDFAFISQAEIIETYLRGWTPPETLDVSWVFREAVSAAQAVRWGCFIWLQYVCYRDFIHSQENQEALDNILSAVSRIRPGSTFDIQFLFPLFMAGVSATLKSERLRIVYRLSILEGNIGTGNIAGAHRLLDTVWKQINEGQEAVDWEALLGKDYSGVVLQ